MTMKRVLIINGPLCDSGSDSCIQLKDDITRRCNQQCEQLGWALDVIEIATMDDVEQWQRQSDQAIDGLIINPAGMDQDSPLWSALLQVLHTYGDKGIAVIEVDTQNFFQTENEARQPIQLPGLQSALICGLGVDSYVAAIRTMQNSLA